MHIDFGTYLPLGCGFGANKETVAKILLSENKNVLKTLAHSKKMQKL